MDSTRSLKYVYVRINLWVLLFLEFFASHSVCTTVAWGTFRSVKFVDEVGSAIFYWNYFLMFATGRTITKADRLVNFTIFHCRMSTIQPTWTECATSVYWHTCYRHFCSCSSHKTIPSLWDFAVTQACFRFFVNSVSIGITQVFIKIARILYKAKL